MPRHCKPHVGRDQIDGQIEGQIRDQTGADLGLDDHLDLEVGQVGIEMDQTATGSISYHGGIRAGCAIGIRYSATGLAEDFFHSEGF